jgi:hypothetical protein
MMETPRFALPLLEPGQAQKEMVHNEAFAAIDLALHPVAEAIGANAAPETPEVGQCWILGDAPAGPWSGHPHALAGWTAGGWRFAAAREGMAVFVRAGEAFALYADGAWRLGELRGKVFVQGLQVVGERQPPIAEPTGGETVDEPARAAIKAVLDALRVHGLIDPDQL